MGGTRIFEVGGSEGARRSQGIGQTKIIVIGLSTDEN